MSRRIWAVGLTIVFGSVALVASGEKMEEKFKEPRARADVALASAHGQEGAGANRLASEASPYLRLHGNNPVDWYPWSDEAFERARDEGKPIFLSVGYSTCYWCHVMEREVFSNKEIAALMNRDFVNVKVDREERPDIDEIYMTAAHLLTRSGGWPNSIFMTPEGEPFFAGTYFPPEDRHGRPGFPTVLAHITRIWRDDREQVLGVAARVAEAMRAAVGSRASLEMSQDPVAALERAVEELAQRYDREHGGFSSGMKFPSPPGLEILLNAAARGTDLRALEMLTRTLDAMALGGIHDHLASGFHRYSTEPSWSVPHFEKMLYDNGQLLGLYARAYATTKRPLYRQVARSIARYLIRDMTHPEGGLYSAQDAEVDGQEGASYVWTTAQIEAVLGAQDAATFLSVYRLAPMHGAEGGVLRVRLPIEPALSRFGQQDVAGLLARFETQREKLLEARGRRRQPLRDEKVLTAWNGLAIRGLVDAGVVLDEPDLLAAATRAAGFVLDRLGQGAHLQRSYVAGQVREEGVLDDYAFLADALLGLHAATGAQRWLEEARALTDRMIAKFQDTANGGFFLTGTDSKLFLRPRSLEDQAEPSGNGVALAVLSHLASETGSAAYAEAREQTLAAYSDLFARMPSAAGTALVGLFRSPSPRPEGLPRSTALPRLPRSEDHVRVRVTRDGEGASTFRVELRIDAGWHVNANPASEAFMIPTEVSLEGGVLGVVDYPPGHGFNPDFSPEPISVYDGNVEISLRIGEGHVPPVFNVRYQACDEARCLPPSTTRVSSD